MLRTTFLQKIEACFRSHPMVGILGPRQCGKTTLARDYIERGDKKIAFEFKYTSMPKVTPSMRSAMEDLDLDEITIVYPGNNTYQLTDTIRVTGLQQLC